MIQFKKLNFLHQVMVGFGWGDCPGRYITYGEPQVQTTFDSSRSPSVNLLGQPSFLLQHHDGALTWSSGLSTAPSTRPWMSEVSFGSMPPNPLASRKRSKPELEFRKQIPYVELGIEGSGKAACLCVENVITNILIKMSESQVNCQLANQNLSYLTVNFNCE